MTLPSHCLECSWLVDKMGACGPPQSSPVFAVASCLPYIIIIVFITLSFITRAERQFKMAVLLLSAYIIGDRILKNLIRSPRPEEACKKTFGFPSSHMVVMVSYSTALWNQCKSSQKMFLIFLTILQGFARVQLKYHTWGQIIGGVIFGLVYALVFLKVYQIIEKQEIFQKILSFFKIQKSKQPTKKTK